MESALGRTLARFGAGYRDLPATLERNFRLVAHRLGGERRAGSARRLLIGPTSPRNTHSRPRPKHRAGGEGVAVDRGYGRRREYQDAGQQPVHPGEHLFGAAGGSGGHPVQVKADGEESAFAGAQRSGAKP